MQQLVLKICIFFHFVTSLKELLLTINYILSRKFSIYLQNITGKAQTRVNSNSVMKRIKIRSTDAPCWSEWMVQVK